MSDFIIPKGMEYTFTIDVKKPNSFILQDLSTMDVAKIAIVKTIDNCIQFESAMVASNVAGRLVCTMSAADTATLNVVRGPIEDGYYLKADYQGIITITFTNDMTPIHVLIDKVFVSPTGATCA